MLMHGMASFSKETPTTVSFPVKRGGLSVLKPKAFVRCCKILRGFQISRTRCRNGAGTYCMREASVPGRLPANQLRPEKLSFLLLLVSKDFSSSFSRQSVALESRLTSL